MMDVGKRMKKALSILDTRPRGELENYDVKEDTNPDSTALIRSKLRTFAFCEAE